MYNPDFASYLFSSIKIVKLGLGYFSLSGFIQCRLAEGNSGFDHY